jgi:hypothetical protein
MAAGRVPAYSTLFLLSSALPYHFSTLALRPKNYFKELFPSARI